MRLRGAVGRPGLGDEGGAQCCRWAAVTERGRPDVCRQVPRRGAATQANGVRLHGHDGSSSGVHGAAGCRDDRPAEEQCHVSRFL